MKLCKVYEAGQPLSLLMVPFLHGQSNIWRKNAFQECMIGLCHPPRKPSQDNKHNSHEIRNKARWNCKAIILQQANPKSTWEKEKWDWWKLFPLCFYFPMSKCISLTPRKGVKEKTSWPLTIRGRKGRNSLEMRGLRAFIVHCQFISHTASPLFANFKPTSSSLWLLPLTLYAFQLIIITICFHYRSFCVASQRKS